MNLKSIYGHGHDTRMNLCDLEKNFEAESPKIARIRKLAESVGCLTHSKNLKFRKETMHWEVSESFSNSTKTTLSKYLKDLYAANKANVKFKKEPVLGDGTAFLIGHNLALTAGHCMYNKAAPNNLKIGCPNILVFNYQVREESIDSGNSKKMSLTFEGKDVYRIQSVVAHQLNENSDWALLKLDRDVEGREPLKINFKAKTKEGTQVEMLGYPSGLPIKLAQGVIRKWENDGMTDLQDPEVRGGDQDKSYFESDLPAFGGNSGSPIFLSESDEGEVVGMLYEGGTDYAEEKGVVVEYTKSEANVKKDGYEKSLKMRSLNFLEATLSSINLQVSNINYKKGLSLEGTCKTDSCGSNKTIVHHIGKGEKINISLECCNVKCPDCKTPLHYDDVNWMILHNCKYTIDAGNTYGNSIMATHRNKVVSQEGGPMKFDLREWYWLELDVDY